jgi:ABC-2 type transport system ATP-binding protein
LGAKVACDAVPALQVTGLTVRYGPAGTRAAVDDLHLTAEAGEVLVLLGPNGAGKTSTMETLEGYRRPASGHVRVLGLDPVADHAALTGHIGVMLQRGGIYPMLSPRRVLDLFAGYYSDPVPTEELLALVGLRAVAATPWRHLSGGEQQRLSLALAVIGRPRVAFLDEPTAGVDPEGRIGIRHVVASLKEHGVCILLTTHELGEADKVADRIAIMSAGRIVREGTPHELVAGITSGGAHELAPAVTVTLSFGAPPGLDVAALAAAVGAGVTVTETAPGRYRLEAAGATSDSVGAAAATAALATFLADRGGVLTDLVVGRTLEEVYFDAVGAATSPESDAPDVSRHRRGSRGTRETGDGGQQRSRRRRRGAR